MHHVLTLVAEMLPEGCEQIASEVLAEYGMGFENGAILSPSHAVEFTLGGETVADMTQIHRTLRDALPGIDLAIVPIGRRRKKVLLADMDSTIVIGETIDELAAALGKGEIVSEITARAMRGEIDFETALDERVAMLKGLEAREIDAVAARLEYAPGARELVATMVRHGARCVLVSGGFDRVTGVVRDTLGFHVDRANHLDVGPDGRLTGTARRPIVDSGTKLATLLEIVDALEINEADALTIGDGANDRPMIEAAGMGIAYRAKPTLREATPFHIEFTDLRTALYFQGYSDDEILA